MLNAFYYTFVGKKSCLLRFYKHQKMLMEYSLFEGKGCVRNSVICCQHIALPFASGESLPGAWCLFVLCNKQHLVLFQDSQCVHTIQALIPQIKHKHQNLGSRS